MVLDELGFENVPIYAPNQDHRLYRDLDIMGGKFTRLGWRGIVSADLLMKMLHQVRFREKTKGAADMIYRESLADAAVAMEKGNGDLYDVLRRSVKTFMHVEQEQTRKPVVAVVGEVYVRHNRFSNDQLIRKVEEFGGQAWLASFSEWVGYVNYISGHRKSAKTPGIGELLRLMLVSHVQHKEERILERLFSNDLSCSTEPDIREIVSNGSDYVPETFEGEAILAVGKAVDCIKAGASGIINAMPFTCMPGTIAGALLTLVQKRYNIPVITLAYDGQGLTNITTPIEAFMYQVKKRAKNQAIPL
jgi:predicted nucleotide-binding protein (sugar kinase/HSP70/actin superfamily)